MKLRERGRRKRAKSDTRRRVARGDHTGRGGTKPRSPKTLWTPPKNKARAATQTQATYNRARTYERVFDDYSIEKVLSVRHLN